MLIVSSAVADRLALYLRAEPKVPAISGLRYVPSYLTAAQAAALLEAIDAMPWLSDLARRVQHYGYRYDYRARRVVPEMYLGPLPPFVRPLADRLVLEGYFAKQPDQAIVNEYEPGQGISHHVDCVPCFGETVSSLSLGSRCEMEFRQGGASDQHLVLEPASLLVLSGEARYGWSHAIRARNSDHGIARRRRVSVTFRTILKDD
jgi:alkylated DNA repair dioxygenase AlkB